MTSPCCMLFISKALLILANHTVKLSRRIENLDKFKPGDDINMAITDEMVVAVVA